MTEYFPPALDASRQTWPEACYRLPPPTHPHGGPDPVAPHPHRPAVGARWFRPGSTAGQDDRVLPARLGRVPPDLARGVLPATTSNTPARRAGPGCAPPSPSGRRGAVVSVPEAPQARITEYFPPALDASRQTWPEACYR